MQLKAQSYLSNLAAGGQPLPLALNNLSLFEVFGYPGCT